MKTITKLYNAILKDQMIFFLDVTYNQMFNNIFFFNYSSWTSGYGF